MFSIQLANGKDSPTFVKAEELENWYYQNTVAKRPKSDKMKKTKPKKGK